MGNPDNAGKCVTNVRNHPNYFYQCGIYCRETYKKANKVKPTNELRLHQFLGTSVVLVPKN